MTLGFKVGIPVTGMFSASNTDFFNNTIPGSSYTSSVPRYTFGLTGEFRLPRQLRLEVDGLYKRAGFANSSTFAGTSDLFYQSTGLNVWEVPVLIKKNIRSARFVHLWILALPCGTYRASFNIVRSLARVESRFRKIHRPFTTAILTAA